MFDRVVAEPARVALVRRRAVLVVAAAVALVYAAVLGAALPVLGRHALHGIIHAIGSTAFAALLLWESAKRDFVVQNGELTISGWFGIGTGVRSNVREAHLETIEREVLYRPSVELRWVVSGRGYVMNTHLRE